MFKKMQIIQTETNWFAQSLKSGFNFAAFNSQYLDTNMS